MTYMFSMSKSDYGQSVITSNVVRSKNAHRRHYRPLISHWNITFLEYDIHVFHASIFAKNRSPFFGSSEDLCTLCPVEPVNGTLHHITWGGIILYKQTYSMWICNLFYHVIKFGYDIGYGNDTFRFLYIFGISLVYRIKLAAGFSVL